MTVAEYLIERLKQAGVEHVFAVPGDYASPFLDALDAAGLFGDGRMLQLNSYENRVLQLHLEDGRIAVAKFYRPGRWSDAQILEEHAFAQDLAAAEVPVAAPWMLVAPGSAILLSVLGFNLLGEGLRDALDPKEH